MALPSSKSGALINGNAYDDELGVRCNFTLLLLGVVCQLSASTCALQSRPDQQVFAAGIEFEGKHSRETVELILPVHLLPPDNEQIVGKSEVVGTSRSQD
jgi:hypothetical protein